MTRRALGPPAHNVTSGAPWRVVDETICPTWLRSLRVTHLSQSGCHDPVESADAGRAHHSRRERDAGALMLSGVADDERDPTQRSSFAAKLRNGPCGLHSSPMRPACATAADQDETLSLVSVFATCR